MKKLLSILTLAVILSCGSKEKTIENTPPTHIVLEKNVKENLEFLTSDALEGRATGSKGIEKAAVFLEDYFKKNNIKPYFKTYRDSFNLKDQDIVGYNIVGYIEGTDPKLKNEFVILGAHYDHIGFVKTVNGDSIANGANDDASGTVAVLEWAKHFNTSKSNKRSILFTLFSAEEIGLKGAEHLAKKLKSENLNLYTMINLEMVGVPRAEEHSMAYITEFKKSNIAEKLNAYAENEIIGFLPKAEEFRLFMRSDNYPFYKNFEVPAHAISTFDFTNFDYYHHVDDEADKMDFKHLTDFINLMTPALEGMVNAPTQEIKLNNE